MRTRCPFGRRVLFCRENPLLENAFLCSRAQASVHLWAGESLWASADDRNRAARCTRRYRPHPPRFARHLPLKGKACGRPQGSPLHKKQTGSVGSAMPGAVVEPHRSKFSVQQAAEGGPQRKAQRSGFALERRSDGVSELCPVWAKRGIRNPRRRSGPAGI